MAKLTLLKVVNTYMDYTDNFPLASIDDTVEGGQVASIAEKVFNDIVNDVFSSSLSLSLIQLEALGDLTKPNYLRIPDTVQFITESQVMYNVTDGETTSSTLQMKQIKYKRPQDFLNEVGLRSTNLPNSTIITDDSGVQFVIITNKAPEYFTSFDDETLIFDSYDIGVDSTLQASKSGIWAKVQRAFIVDDTYIIDLPEWFQQGYLNAVIAEASEALREEPMPSIARKARMALIKARKKQRVGSKGLSTKSRSYGRQQQSLTREY